MINPTRRQLLRLLIFFTLLLSLLGQNAIAFAKSDHDKSDCKDHRKISEWKKHTIEHNGFMEREEGSGSISLNQHRELELFLQPTTSTSLSVARIQDYTTDPLDRDFCWNPDEGTVTVSFDQFYNAPAIRQVTANNLLWNAPQASSTGAQTYSAFGLTRTGAFGPAKTYIIMVEDLSFPSFQSAMTKIVPLRVAAPWLVETQWFSVDITVTATTSQVTVGQNGQFATVSATLPHPPGLLGMEFSIDNESTPGVRNAIPSTSGVTIGAVEIEQDNDHGHGHDY
jgi:hypothetical protein